MPKFIKENEIKNSHNNFYYKLMNESYNKELIFDFYWKLFQKKNPDGSGFENHPLVGKKLLSLSEEFYIMKDKISTSPSSSKLTESDFNVKSIFYKKFIPIDLSPNNLLFLKFMKFHLGFLKFNDWYSANNFKDLEIDLNLMREYLTKGFFVCLEKNKRTLKTEINTMTDFQIISNICIKERLTLFNFMVSNTELNSTDIKNFINRQYMQVFRNRNYLPVLNEVVNIKNVTIDDYIEVYKK
jgi:hypothetical protein